MKPICKRVAFLPAVAGLALGLGCAPVLAQQVPAQPAPVAVSVDATTAAVIVMDVVSGLCDRQPACVAMVPHVSALIGAARKAGALVVYSAPEPNGVTAPVTEPPFLPAIAPQPGDQVILGSAQDRFFATPLDQLLRRHGIATVILAGWRENGSVLYTAVGASLHGYTSVVADDATGAGTDYDVAIGRYQLLTQLSGNPKNEPLHKGATTLSRSDLITFR
jgi:nicotinamidase-related amidase